MRYLMIFFIATLAAATARPQAPAPAQAQPAALPYTVEQAARGKQVYEESCLRCHGAHLNDGAFGSALKGPVFMYYNGGKTVEQIYSVMSTTMPAGNPGTLSATTYVDLMAYILQSNGARPGKLELPADAAQRAALVLPNGDLLATSPFDIKWPTVPTPDRFAHWTSVTPALLAKPPAYDWLSWRRTYDVHGYSPLAQINKANVTDLQLAWSWALPTGPSLAAPLVHDGVMFVMGMGDRVEALDAVNGDLLWAYARQLPKGAYPTVKRGLALLGDRVYVATSDVHVVALNAKTGALIWDQEVGDYKAREGITGGLLAVDGRILVGTAGTGPGTKRPQIVGLDADTGAIAWRLHTIAETGEPGDHSWNGVPLELRSGASVWNPGSYDPEAGLAYFGTANTYDTGPLLHPSGKPGETSDALYTDSTLAIDARTGKLAWSFQHFPNDQWDQDWAFEQQIVQLPFQGQQRTAIVSSGKSAIYDAVDATTGQFLFAVDVGLQTIIKSIDPKTGHKNVDPYALPGEDQRKVICPDVAGAKSYMPGAYDAAAHIVYVPLVESCMDMYPAPGGMGGGLTSGVMFGVRPRPDGDGNYGRLQALNLLTRKPQWVTRQRVPFSTGVLATAGGLIFVGDVARYFRAFDALSGKPLWQVRLNDASGSNPITYAVNGDQYVALVVGRGEFRTVTSERLLPELHNPQTHGAAVWVFKLRAAPGRK